MSLINAELRADRMNETSFLGQTSIAMKWYNLKYHYITYCITRTKNYRSTCLYFNAGKCEAFEVKSGGRDFGPSGFRSANVTKPPGDK
jgi:hypothetical protein